MTLRIYPPNPAYGERPQFRRCQERIDPPPAPNAYVYYEASFADSEGPALTTIRDEWLACVSTAADTLSEPVSDSIQINGTAGATNLNVWTPRLISGVSNQPQFSELQYITDNSTGVAVARPGLAVLFSGDPVTPAVSFQGYLWENAAETPAMRIMKCTSATASSTLATIAQAAKANSVYRIEADFSGADVNLRVLEDGIQILNATDVGGFQTGVPGFERRVLANTRLFRFKNFRCGILAYA